jgi:hypothetical protein
MYEYKVVYWEDSSGEFTFGVTIKSRFEHEVNELAQEGWVVKYSNIAISPQTSNERRIIISAYALLEKENIQAPFRETPKT